MTRHKTPIGIILFILAFNFCFGQDIPGYNTSNYAGVSGIDIQPASIADMRYKFDMTLFGVGLSFDNNYLGLKTSALLKSGSKNNSSTSDIIYELKNNDPKAVA